MVAIAPTQLVYQRPKSLADTPTHYCPGCTHGVAHRLIAEVLDEMNVRELAIGVAPVGCSVFAYNYFDCDFVEAAHGRAPAMATGIKRVLPDKIVFTYQGDGDLASIGMAEIVHSAARGENITVVFINNAIYGMTGGQMAPTTLIGQKTSTTPGGRTPKEGHPLHVAELLAAVEGSSFICRTSVHSAGNVLKTKRAIEKSFRCQMEEKGFSLVEILSPCPVDWKKSPVESLNWMREKMIPVFPLGTFKDIPGEEDSWNTLSS
jgi:2-oxoglutarate/2-oxoacid ferredoxin oxidoreductase subunit beta